VLEGYGNMREMIDELKETPAEASAEDRLELASMSLKEKKARKKADFDKRVSVMDGKEKRNYIIRYYLPIAGIVLAVIACIVGISVVVYKNSRPVAISYAIVNVDDEFALDLTPFDDYVATLDVDNDAVISSDVSHYFNPTAFSDGTLGSTTLDDYTAFDMLCDEGFYDVIITDKAGLTYFCEIDAVQLLDNYLPENLRTKLSDRIISVRDSQGDMYESAIDISDTAFAKSLNTGYSQIYLVFPGTKEENRTRAMSFVEYIFD
jgi:hypothetical protein